ncbi:hypothetical protein Tsubulata_020816 [Turnera subulata]|uniref:Protein kinase domain-containing protein n=1 Tax=Turnera subulata TaxID=218843 RepID=A0A9Q0JI51_9ROSI|nr:hypothetical protein Tsubulata_020816 [Turnera subulata]
MKNGWVCAWDSYPRGEGQHRRAREGGGGMRGGGRGRGGGVGGGGSGLRGDMAVESFWDTRLRRFTDGYDPKNLIGNFQFGKVYRGVYRFAQPTPDRRNITVKVWEDENQSYKVLPGDNEIRFLEELELLEFFKLREEGKGYPYHRNLAKLLEYYTHSARGQLIMVYDLDPWDTVQNLLDKDDFIWPMRFKVACGVASVLKFLHAQNPDVPYLVRNLAAAHIMLDQAQEPVLFDFSMISGGILYDKRNILNEPVNGCHGYVDPTGAHAGVWSEKCDVFSYGVLLLQLVSKGAYLEEYVFGDEKDDHDWAWRGYRALKSGSSKGIFSLVPNSLKSDPLFNSIKVAKLALKCVQNDPRKRPSMEQVYRHLMKLHVAESDAAIQGEGSKLGAGASNLQSDKLSGRRSLQEDNTLQLFSYEELSEFTDDFGDEKRIGDFQFGKLYRGKIKNREVVVKMWQCGGTYHALHDDNTLRLRDEIILLKLPELTCCPNVVKLIGYCREGIQIGVVYDLKALDTVSNLIDKDSLTWLQTVKIGIGLAFLVEFLHTDKPPKQPYIVCSIIPSNIMLDQDFSPVLIDYGQFGGGILPKSRPVKGSGGIGCYGYIGGDYFWNGYIWTQSCDVYAYATVLLSLLCKRLFTEEERLSGRPDVAEWAVNEFKASSSTDCSLVHKSFEEQPGYYRGDAVDITKLAMECVASEPLEAPTMKQVVKRLLKLKVVRTHAAQLGISKQLSR